MQVGHYFILLMQSLKLRNIKHLPQDPIGVDGRASQPVECLPGTLKILQTHSPLYTHEMLTFSHKVFIYGKIVRNAKDLYTFNSEDS